MSAITSQHNPIGIPPSAGRAGAGPIGAILAPITILIRHRALIARMARREIQARYRGSLLGIGWAILTPLALLGVYTFVFAVVLKARWTVLGSELEGTGAFAARVFLGLILFQVLAAMMTQTPTLMPQHRALVKKVVFPVETLVAIRLAVALFDFLAGYVVFVALGLLLGAGLGWGVLLAPLLVIPVSLLGLGAGWLLAGLGAYVRDLAPLAATGATLVLFMSAVFYPIEIVPDRWMWVIAINPVAIAIDAARGFAFEPLRTDGLALLMLSLGSWLASVLGLLVFRRLRWGFADVL